MTSSARVLFRGDPDVYAVLTEAFGDSVVLVPAAEHDPSVGRTVDCRLIVGPPPDDLDAEGVPAVVVVGDAETRRTARLAGARVLPRTALDEPDVLLAQIDATVRERGIHGAGRRMDGGRRTARSLERLLEATHDLMAAEDDVTVCRIAVTAANEVLGLDLSAICLATDDDRLEPVAYTDAVELSLGTVPTLGTDSLAWDVFESGEGHVYQHLDKEEDLHNPETKLRSEMLLSLGSHGVFLASFQEADAFDDADVYFAKLLAATAESALDRAARRSELEHKNAQLEEFVGVVSHDLRNPLTVARGGARARTRNGRHGASGGRKIQSRPDERDHRRVARPRPQG